MRIAISYFRSFQATVTPGGAVHAGARSNLGTAWPKAAIWALLLSTAVSGMVLRPGHAAAASCPSGKEISSVSGTISKVDNWNDGRFQMLIHECKDLEVYVKRSSKCRPGRHISAKGRFYLCDAFDYEDGECIRDELYADTYSCN